MRGAGITAPKAAIGVRELLQSNACRQSPSIGEEHPGVKASLMSEYQGGGFVSKRTSCNPIGLRLC